MRDKTRKLPESWPVVHHAVACPKTTRTFTNVAVDKDGNLVEFKEMVHQHDVYRLKIEGKKKADKRLWHRGALVGVLQ